jgi:hypothetical protein
VKKRDNALATSELVKQREGGVYVDDKATFQSPHEDWYGNKVRLSRLSPLL